MYSSEPGSPASADSAFCASTRACASWAACLAAEVGLKGGGRASFAAAVSAAACVNGSYHASSSCRPLNGSTCVSAYSGEEEEDGEENKEASVRTRKTASGSLRDTVSFCLFVFGFVFLVFTSLCLYVLMSFCLSVSDSASVPHLCLRLSLSIHVCLGVAIDSLWSSREMERVWGGARSL